MKRPTLAIAATTLLCFAVFRAHPQDKPKRFSGYLINATVAKDAKCMRDYANAIVEGGVKGRITLADLSNFGCIEQLRGVWHAEGDDPPQVFSKTIAAYRLFAIWDVTMTQLLNPRVADSLLASPDHDFTKFDVWVRREDFHRIGSQELEKMIKALK
jgi:hypothetical protein